MIGDDDLMSSEEFVTSLICSDGTFIGSMANERNEGIVYKTEIKMTGNTCLSIRFLSDEEILCRVVIGFDTARYLSNARVIVMYIEQHITI